MTNDTTYKNIENTPPEERSAFEKVGKTIYIGKDNAYRWSYEVNLLKNPTILITILKIFGGIILGMMFIAFLIQLFGDHEYQFILELGGIMGGIFLGLSLIGYFIYACIMGFKYCVKFTMDANGILHQQEAKQAKKADKIAEATMLAGAMTGNITTMGIGLSHSGRTAMHTTFKGTKKITAIKRRNLIKLDSLLDHNQVYCDTEDFDFVWNYIKEHCPDAKVKK